MIPKVLIKLLPTALRAAKVAIALAPHALAIYRHTKARKPQRNPTEGSSNHGHHSQVPLGGSER
jgi:hypothetical protein